MTKPVAITATAIGCYALVIAALTLMPIANAWVCAIATAAMWLLIAAAYRLTREPTATGWVTLTVCATLLSIGVVANTYAATTLRTGIDAMPVLDNFDMNEYWKEAQSWTGEGSLHYYLRCRLGYGAFIALIWKLTGGAGMFFPLLFNALFTLLAIVLSGVATRIALSGHTNWSDSKLQTAAMIFTAAVAYFLFSGTLLLREAPASLAVGLMAVGIARSIRKPWSSGAVYFLAGATIIAAIRPSWALLSCIGAVMIWGRSQSRWTIALFSLIFVMVQWAVIDYYMRDLGNVEFFQDEDAFAAADFLHDTSERHAYNVIFGERYFSAPLLGKLALLPIAAAIQYLTPFPWAFQANMTLPTEALLKLTYVWYAIGGLIIYYIISTIYRAAKQPAWTANAGAVTNRLLLCGVIYWIGTVYVSGGSVARYGVPLLPLVIPAAVWVVAERRRLPRLGGFAIFYACIIAGALITAKMMQSH